MPDVELYTFPGSNAGLSTELLLDHAGIGWTEHRLRPGLHVASLRARGFDANTVPAARIDGARVQGSRRIARVVADRCPQAQLLPMDAATREVVLEAERLAERLQVAARRLVYVLAQERPAVVRPLVDANYAGVPHVLRPAITRGLIFGARHGHGARADRAGHELERAAHVLDRLDELVLDSVLATTQPTVADFQAAPNLALLATSPQLDEVLRQRPCWAIAQRLLPRYPLAIRVDAPEAWARRLER